MKKIINTLAAFVAISLAVAACQTVEIENPAEENKPEEVTPVQVMNTYTFAIVNDNNATKTVIGDDGVNKFAEWEDGDHLAYLINDSGSTYSEVEVGGSSVTFNVTGALTAGDYLFAWYPNYEATEASSTVAKFNVPYAQTQDVSTGYDLDAFPMVAKPIEVTSSMLEGYNPDADNSKPLADVRFANLGSLINFKVFSSIDTYQAEKVISVTFDAGTDYIAGTYAVDLTGIDFDDEASLVLRSSQSTSPLEKGSSIITTTLSAEQSLSTHTTKGTALDVYMTVIPGSYSGHVVVLTDKAAYTYTISSPKVFARGSINTLGLDLNKAGSTAIRQTPVSWDLTTATYNTPTSATIVTWENDVVDMVATKESSTTDANSYLGGANNRTSSRFYKDSKLTFTPKFGARILRVSYSATTTSYASALGNSSWSNAHASASEKIVTIETDDPASAFYATIGATTGSDGVKVFYYGATDPALSGASLARTSPLSGNETSTLSPRNLTNITYSVISAPAFVDGENISFAGNVMTVPFLNNKTLDAKDGTITVRATGDEGTADAEIAVSQSASVFTASSTDDINIAWNDQTTKTITFTSSFALTDSNISNDNTTDFSASFAVGVNPNEYILSIAANADNESGDFNLATISVSRDGLTAVDIDVYQAYNGGTTPLSAPANVTITAMSTGGFSAKWDDNGDADGFSWWLSTDAPLDFDGTNHIVASGNQDDATPADGKYTLNASVALTGKTTYYIYVKAEGSGSWTDSDYGVDYKAYMILDGSWLTSTATSGTSTDKTVNAFTLTFGSGAKQQSVPRTATNYFTNDSGAMLIPSGSYVYNKTAIPGVIAKFEIYANKNASTGTTAGVMFSSTSIAAYSSSGAYSHNLNPADAVYDCSEYLVTNSKYFWCSISSKNAQVQFRILYTPE